MRQADRVRLLHGPYHPPLLRVGERASCLFKDCTVVVTTWTDARTPWPRCVPVGGRSHPSLLVDEELARAGRAVSRALTAVYGVSPGNTGGGGKGDGRDLRGAVVAWGGEVVGTSGAR
jgi:hypothetical protein